MDPFGASILLISIHWELIDESMVGERALVVVPVLVELEAVDKLDSGDVGRDNDSGNGVSYILVVKTSFVTSSLAREIGSCNDFGRVEPTSDFDDDEGSVS